MEVGRMTSAQGEEIRSVRIGICANVFLELLSKPQRIPNIGALITKAMHVYANGDYEQTLDDLGSKWRPSGVYMLRQFQDIRNFLATTHRKHLLFVRNAESGFGPGTWKFATKEELEKCMVRENNSISTLTTHHNEQVEAGNDHYASLHLPILKEVELLTYAN